jgi:hypothetical protein
VNVVVLRHHAKDHVGLVGEELASRGATIHSLLCGPGFSGAFPDIDDVELIIVLGSTFSVYDAEVRANWLSREIEYLDEARSRGLAIWGICFGAQILCLMSGGEVAEAPRVKSVGTWWSRFPTTPCHPAPGFDTTTITASCLRPYGVRADVTGRSAGLYVRAPRCRSVSSRNRSNPTRTVASGSRRARSGHVGR